MKAVVITKPGGIDVLEIHDVEDAPVARTDRVRVRVHAAGLNRADIIQRRGFYPAPPGAPSDIPGLEFAGEVEQVGPDVRQFQAGDRVFGICGGGAHAEYVTVPASHLARVPNNLEWADAAAVPEVFMTAHDALFTQANLQPGETVLVHAAGSGVGTAAIQLIRASGARSFGTSRTAYKLERAKQYGLDESFVVSGEPLSLVEPVKEWSGGTGVDVVLDLVGSAYFEVNLRSMALQARMIHVGTTSGSKATFDLGLVMSKRLSLKGTVLRARSVEEKATVTRLFAKHVVPLLASGVVKPVVDRTYQLDEVRDAHARMESNENFGKIVLMI
jgi:putative PIG3 family NAD(P)H quinone oxidoreductase